MLFKVTQRDLTRSHVAPSVGYHFEGIAHSQLHLEIKFYGKLEYFLILAGSTPLWPMFRWLSW